MTEIFQSLAAVAVFLIAFTGAGAKADTSFVHDPCPSMNAERVKKGLRPLEHDEALARIADDHAVDMVERGYFSHTSPEGDGMTDRLREGGIAYGYAGENIAMGYETCRAAMRGWMASKGHRANILNPKFRSFGLGIESKHYVMVFTD